MINQVLDDFDISNLKYVDVGKDLMSSIAST